MSAIRPDLPAVRPRSPDQAASSSTLRQAQAAFFRAALGEVQAAPIAQTAARTAAPVRATPQTTAPAASETGRTLRPGSLLDIKV